MMHIVYTLLQLRVVITSHSISIRDTEEKKADRESNMLHLPIWAEPIDEALY